MDERNSGDKAEGRNKPTAVKDSDLKPDEGKNREHRRDRWIAATERWGGTIDIFFNAIVTAFTIAVGITTILQWPLAKEALKASKDSNAAMADQLKEMRTQNELTRAAYRPIVTFGAADGELVRYKLAPKGHGGRSDAAVIAYFRNVGTAPALHFAVDAYGIWGDREALIEKFGKSEQGRLQRYAITSRSEDARMVSWRFPGRTLGPGAVEERLFMEGDTPSKKEWEKIRAGKIEYRVEGTFEYCDEDGNWTCEWFRADYVPATDQFVRDWFTGPIQEACRPFTRPPFGGSNDQLVIEVLPPCESRAERLQREEEYRAKLKATIEEQVAQ